jgi:putative OmpL-like beta-barrel porin-2
MYNALITLKVYARRALFAALAAMLVVLSPVRAGAQSPPPPDNPGAVTPPATPADPKPADPKAADPAAPEAGIIGFFKNTELGGLADVYYDYYSTKPSGDAQYRNFDTKHNQFGFSMAELWVAKGPSPDQRAGFKVRFTIGPAATLIHAAEPGTTAIFQNIEEGFVSYLAPVGKGLQFDVGKFTTPIGAEVIESKDNWNYSRSLLFALAIPYYHSGVRATYTVNDKVAFMADVVNGWNDVTDNNARKSFGVQATVKPTAALSIVQNYMAGPEQPHDNVDWRHLSDTIVTLTVNPKVSLMANYDYGSDTIAGVKGHWQGVAGYARFQPNKYVAISPRVEWYQDAAGFTTGTPQTLKEVTSTVELKGKDNFLWRIEYRGDFSDAPVFTAPSGSVKRQHSIGFGVLYWFSTKG